MGAFLFTGLITSAPASADSALVRRALDGDTLILNDGRHLRLIGINAPELGKDGAPDQPVARAARMRLAQLTQSRRVTLVFEHERHDRYGRALAHALLADGQSVEEIMLRQGLAWMVAIPPNVERLSHLQGAEKEARTGRLGVWNEPAYQPVPAEKLTVRDTGFGIVEGRIQSWRQRRHVIYFELAPRVNLLVPNEDWKKYFSGKPAELVGRRVLARGWLTEYKGGLHLRVPHSAMLTSPN